MEIYKYLLDEFDIELNKYYILDEELLEEISEKFNLTINSIISKIKNSEYFQIKTKYIIDKTNSKEIRKSFKLINPNITYNIDQIYNYFISKYQYGKTYKISNSTMKYICFKYNIPCNDNLIELLSNKIQIYKTEEVYLNTINKYYIINL